MKRIDGTKGFSLIELLTVIAIIAILAGIIFPVMGVVKARAKNVQCITNLHDVAMALKMFQQDNRRYPSTLAGTMQVDNNSDVIPLEQTRGDALYPEYMKSIKGFHCPLSPTTDTSALIILTDTDGETYHYYAYDSYDAFYPEPVAAGSSVAVNWAARHYKPNWAPTQAAVPPLSPYPPGTTDSAELQTFDYKRQLRFRQPSDDTVVTWCSYHNRGGTKAMVPVLFLDGHADMMPAVDVEGPNGDTGSRWRTQPKRG